MAEADRTWKLARTAAIVVFFRPSGPITGRNQPSNYQIHLRPGPMVAGLDTASPRVAGSHILISVRKRLAIAAALSGDERMADGYLERAIPYLAFAKAAQIGAARCH